MATWVMTSSVENLRICEARGFDVIGFKERRRRQAEQVAPGDEVVFYCVVVQAFGAIARVTSPMFEDRTPIWPQGRKKHPEDYPWRVHAEPVVVLADEDLVPAVELIDELDHVQKWPREHWHLAFQGQLRTVGDHDAELLRERLAVGPAAEPA